jgi:hypothetical protein
MLFRAAADFVLVVHLGFILFVVFGGWFVLRRPWIAWLHLPAAFWGAVIEFSGWVCPLTPLENRLRAASGSAGYDGSFIEHYLIPLIYPTAMNRGLQIVLGLGVILINSAFYSLLIRRRLCSKPK